MGKLRIAFLSFLKDISIYVMVILETAAVFFVLNMVVAGIDNQKMLLRPFEKILNKPGIVFCEDASIAPQYPTPNGYYEDISNTLEKIKDVEIFEYTGVYLEYGEKDLDVIVYDDSLVPLSLPLKKGKWAKELLSGVVSQNNINLELGSIVSVSGFEIKISGMLTDPTYRPSFLSYSPILDMDECYESYRLNDSNADPFLLIPLSSIPSEKREAFWESFGPNHAHTLLISYGENHDEETMKENEAMLSELGFTAPLSEVYDNSIEKVNDMLEMFLPLFVVTVLIILIGFITNKAVRMQNSRNDILVYSLCGADDKDLFKIFIWQDVILLAVSVILSTFALVLCKNLGIATGLGMHLSLYNFAATLAGTACYMAVSLAVNIILRRIKYD